MALHEAPEDGSREPCSRGQVVGVPDPTDLPPGGIDVGLLVATHDLGTEASGDAVSHRAVELAEPSVLRWRQGVLVSRPLAVQRRRQLGRVAPPHDGRQPSRQLRRLRRQRRGGRAGRAQRSEHRDRPRLFRKRRDVWVGGGGEDAPPAERGRGVLWSVQALSHRLDVVGDRSRELPEVVHRQLDGFDRREVPRRRERVADRLSPQSTLHSVVEGRNDGREVAGVRLQ